MANLYKYFGPEHYISVCTHSIHMKTKNRKNIFDFLAAAPEEQMTYNEF